MAGGKIGGLLVWFIILGALSMGCPCNDGIPARVQEAGDEGLTLDELRAQAAAMHIGDAGPDPARDKEQSAPFVASITLCSHGGENHVIHRGDCYASVEWQTAISRIEVCIESPGGTWTLEKEDVTLVDHDRPGADPNMTLIVYPAGGGATIHPSPWLIGSPRPEWEEYTLTLAPRHVPCDETPWLLPCAPAQVGFRIHAASGTSWTESDDPEPGILIIALEATTSSAQAQEIRVAGGSGELLADGRVEIRERSWGGNQWGTETTNAGLLLVQPGQGLPGEITIGRSEPVVITGTLRCEGPGPEELPELIVMGGGKPER
ncbi:MAG: hypothetical protein ACYTFG_09050 [Planctomycetota bacterium]|jgi:hypothetical protein